MKATARRASATGFTHRVGIRNHQLIADEPVEQGGDDEGPSPQELLAASLATCTAVTVEMYAKRKGWDIGPLEVVCDYTPAERGCPTK
ncbi:OsmC family protein, partial [Klebsiella pneumoniae]